MEATSDNVFPPKTLEVDESDYVVDINGKMGLDSFIVDSCGYRDGESSYDSSSDSSESIASSSYSSLSVSSEDEITKEKQTSNCGKNRQVKTRGELSLDDLPKIEELNIVVAESELKAIGKISGIVEQLLVVSSFKNSPPLDIDSVLFLSDGKPIGKIYDVFGPVVEPLYAIRFNCAADIQDKGFVKEDIVYYAPQNTDVTAFVFVDSLRSEKGSDASWTNNNEPPVEFLDYSDDEKERQARQKHRAKTRSNDITITDVIPKKVAHVDLEKETQLAPQNQTSPQPVLSNPFYYPVQNQPVNVHATDTVQRFSQSIRAPTTPQFTTPPNFAYRQNSSISPGFLFSPPIFFQSPQLQVPTHFNQNFRLEASPLRSWSLPNQQNLKVDMSNSLGDIKRFSAPTSASTVSSPNASDLPLMPAASPPEHHRQMFRTPPTVSSEAANRKLFVTQATNEASVPLRFPSPVQLPVNWQQFHQPVFGMLPGNSIRNQRHAFEGVPFQKNLWCVPVHNRSPSPVIQVPSPLPATIIPVSNITASRSLMPQQANVLPVLRQHSINRLPFYDPSVPPPRYSSPAQQVELQSNRSF